MMGRSNKSGNMSLASDSRDALGDSDDRNLTLELGNAPGKKPAKSSAHAQRGDHGSVDWGMLNSGKGIVVTKEVHVTYTEEERIERVIGF